jgi:hypothetical protein
MKQPFLLRLRFATDVFVATKTITCYLPLPSSGPTSFRFCPYGTMTLLYCFATDVLLLRNNDVLPKRTMDLSNVIDYNPVIAS